MRAPATERSTTSASRASITGAMSPMGEAVTRLPASVARLRICREAKTLSIFTRPGRSSPRASSRAVRVAPPPTVQCVAERSTRCSSGTLCVLTSMGNSLKLLVDLDAHLGGPGHEHGVGRRGLERAERVERGGRHEALVRARIIEVRELLVRLREREPEAIVRIRTILHAGGAVLERVDGGLADGSVPGAAAEVAAELVGEGRSAVEVVAVVRLEHRHHEARGAVAALRAVAVDHGALHGVDAALGDPLGGDDLAARDHREEGDAGVDGPPGAGARAAVALGAALLGGGESLCAEPAEEGEVRRGALDPNHATVDLDVEAFAHGAAETSPVRPPWGAIALGLRGKRGSTAPERRGPRAGHANTHGRL